jgi:outer membrane protein assembly factor BamE
VKIHRHFNLHLRTVFVGLCVVILASCVYKLDIQQGNVLERDKVAQLKVGMTKRQVRYLLGTPLIIDTFNQDRWDYFYSLKDYSPEHREGIFHQERLTIFFENGQLSKMDNQLMAAKLASPVHVEAGKDAEVAPGPTGEDQPNPQLEQQPGQQSGQQR